MARLDRFIGYYRPYATSHEELDGDIAAQDEVRNIGELRGGNLSRPDAGLARSRQK